MTRYKGRPVRGAISGFFAGFFIAIDLMFMGAIRTDSILVTVLPIAGLIIGLLLGLWAPLGRAPAPARMPAPPDLSPYIDAPPAAPPPPSGDPVQPPAAAPPTIGGTAVDPTPRDELQPPPPDEQ